MTRAPPKKPLIAVIGATGTGKSQLAVEIAKRYNGEVINGDAMQLYAGLPIITNKITDDERQGVMHHLLGCIGLQEQTWEVGKFVKAALKVIEEIRSRGKLPVLVGGTHYYTQSLLFHDRLAESQDGGRHEGYVEDKEKQWPVLQKPTEALLEELRRVDPVMAERWHPNDRRKIQRSLEIYLQTGKRASEVYAEQRQRKLGDHKLVGDAALQDEPSLRFPALIFWVHAETEALRDRLDRRVDKMLDAGLLDEVHTLNAHAEAQSSLGLPVDETRGIWVSIGYKEFKAYAATLKTGSLDAPSREALNSEATERTRIATRQYSKRQIRWIRIKLVNSLLEAHASKQLYLLDGSDAASFEKEVVEPALQLTQQWLGGVDMPDPQSLSAAAEDMLKPKRDYDLSASPDKWAKKHCEVCGVTTVTEEQWQQHAKSKAHRKLVSKRKRHEAGAVSITEAESVDRAPTT